MIPGQDIIRAARILRQGGLVAFPTETVYGLGADACNDEAVARVFAAKGRPQFNPLIAHVTDLAAAEKLGVFPAAARALADAFWPGPLTLVVERAAGCPVSRLASAGLSSLALRVPAHTVALALLAEFGGPVVAPSANASGRISPTSAAHVRASLGEAVDMILDGGPSQVGVESTVVSFLDGPPRLLRPGGLPREEIEACLGTRLAQPAAGPLHSPGQIESHYAPRATLRLNAEAPVVGEVYLGFGIHRHGPHTLSATGNLIEAAANLFRMLHDLDAQGPRRIAVAPIPHAGLGDAINDRLNRAAAPRSS
ncbi:MAG: threonylcarbamoyl-AMP synthase [Rhizobiales bacterium]|nr:threonylcarbamoyl-AMP synthase [Hyphomicrobiales bacterium]